MASSNNTGNNEKLTPSVEETPLNDSGSIVRVQSYSWIWFINKERIHDIDPVQCGKWMFFFSPFKTALMDDIVGTAVLDGVVVEAKYSNPETLIAAGSKHGVCCFYLNGNDNESHKRVLSYMLENGLIRKTKTGKLYNISFKFDSETYAGKYKGSGFSGKIKLADFVDLEKGEFIKDSGRNDELDAMRTRYPRHWRSQKPYTAASKTSPGNLAYALAKIAILIAQICF